MFYAVGDEFGNVNVYGKRDDELQLIDPHDIFRTRTIGYDNIHRGILTHVADVRVSRDFCRFLKYRFPSFENFFVSVVYYPSVTKDKYQRRQQTKYQCFSP